MVLGKFFCNCVFDEEDFDKAQLTEIKLGLLEGINVNYAIPTHPATEMRKIREAQLKKQIIKLFI